MDPLGRCLVGHRQDRQHHLGRFQRVVAARRSRRRAPPHYHHRRPPISGAPSTVVRTSPSRLSLRMVFEGQRTMVPGLARSRPGARSRGHDIVQSGRFRTPAIADLHERPVISKRLPPSTPRVGTYRQSTTRREESGPADSARRSSTVSLPLGRVFSESTAANGDCDSVVIGLIGGGLVGDSQARCEPQGRSNDPVPL